MLSLRVGRKNKYYGLLIKWKEQTASHVEKLKHRTSKISQAFVKVHRNTTCPCVHYSTTDINICFKPVLHISLLIWSRNHLVLRTLKVHHRVQKNLPPLSPIQSPSVQYKSPCPIRLRSAWRCSPTVIPVLKAADFQEVSWSKLCVHFLWSFKYIRQEARFVSRIGFVNFLVWIIQRTEDVRN